MTPPSLEQGTVRRLVDAQLVAHLDQKLRELPDEGLVPLLEELREPPPRERISGIVIPRLSSTST